MKTRKYIFTPLALLAIIALCSLVSCHKQEEFPDDPYGNFDALWTQIDEHYCFFKYKNIDWTAIGQKYRAQLRADMSETALYDVCAAMLKELRDGHTNLASSWNVSRYWIWEKYPKNYDERLIDQYYLNFNYQRASGMKYEILSNNFGYLYYGDFTNEIGEGNLDNVLAYLASSDGLIIDVRDNGGGLLANVETLVSRFITERMYVGSISHKTGPGHNDFSTPYKYYFDPVSGSHIKYLKPIVVLTNRASFSATNNFASIMQFVHNVKIVGDSTGGGSGLPFTSEIPNGWSVRFSACSMTDAAGRVTEFGVAPSEGCKVNMTAAQIAAGKDAILEKAFEVLTQMCATSK